MISMRDVRKGAYVVVPSFETACCRFRSIIRNHLLSLLFFVTHGNPLEIMNFTPKLRQSLYDILMIVSSRLYALLKRTIKVKMVDVAISFVDQYLKIVR